MALERISATCSPLTMSTYGGQLSTSFDLLEQGVSPALISKTVTNVLRLEMGHDEILPLLHSLIDGLSEEISSSARGSSLILCSMLETRGQEEEVMGQSTILVGKIHGKLLLNLESDETRGRALMAVRILASHNAVAVIDSLLAEHLLPFDDAVVSRSLFFHQEKPSIQ